MEKQITLALITEMAIFPWSYSVIGEKLVNLAKKQSGFDPASSLAHDISLLGVRTFRDLIALLELMICVLCATQGYHRDQANEQNWEPF